MKNGFHLFTCNNLEDLGRAYSTYRLKKQEWFRKGGFFERERICVATQGMGIWLMQYLVGHGHVAANVEYPFIRNVIDEILATFMEGDASYKPELFKEQVLIWRIYRLLGGEQVPEKLSNYLNVNHGDYVRRYQLSVKLAQLYYDYLAFIPEKLEGLEAVDEQQQWQIDLWKQLCRDENGGDITSPAAAMLKFIDRTTELDGSKYKPVTFFGISAMAPYFLVVLKKLSSVQPVNFFYLNYCDEYWADVKSDKEKWHETQEKVDEQFNNSLLGNLGMLGREFFKAVIDLDDDVFSPLERESWIDVDNVSHEQKGKMTLLGELQQGIRFNLERTSDEQTANGRVSVEEDDSLTVHSCFNNIRQVEALQNCLLRLLNEYKHENKFISLNDIIVMAPDIAGFASAIQTVFDKGPLKGKYCISDRSVKNSNYMAETFLNIMSISKGHFEVSRINSLLESSALRRKFGFGDDEISTLRSWFQKAGIRWGQDEKERSDCGSFEEYSWQYGMDRLLVKLAMDGKGNEGEDIVCFAGLNPVDYSVGKENQALLNGLCRLYRSLRDFVAFVQRANGGITAQKWCDFLTEQRAVFFQADSDSAKDYSQLGRTLSNLKAALEVAGFSADEESQTADMRVPFEVILSAMTASLETPAVGEPFLNGKITFCSLLPMRGIPCKVIALLGMDVGTFPRRDDATGYNLVRMSKGTNLLKYYNRSRSIEDRFTFLEALMSAKDYFLVFYNGQDDQTMKEKLAAAPVNEMLAFTSKVQNGVGKSLVVEHPLNAFAPASFKEIPAYKAGQNEGKQHTGALLKIFSFDAEMGKLAQRLHEQAEDGSKKTRQLWIEAYSLPVVLPNVWKKKGEISITMSELLGYLKSPADTYMSHRLGLPQKEWEREELTDYEPFALEKQAANSLKRTLGTAIIAADATEKIDAIYWASKAKCELPAGQLGEIAFNCECWGSEIQNQSFKEEYRKQEQSEAREIEVVLETINLWEEWCGLGLDVYGIPCPLGLKELPSFDVKLIGKIKFYEDKDSLGVRECLYLNDKEKFGRKLLPFYVKHLLLGAWRETGICRSSYIKRPKDKAACVLETIDNEGEKISFLTQLRRMVGLYMVGCMFPLPLLGRSPEIVAGETKSNSSSEDCVSKILFDGNESLLFREWMLACPKGANGDKLVDEVLLRTAQHIYAGFPEK